MNRGRLNPQPQWAQVLTASPTTRVPVLHPLMSAFGMSAAFCSMGVPITTAIFPQPLQVPALELLTATGAT